MNNNIISYENGIDFEVEYDLREPSVDVTSIEGVALTNTMDSIGDATSTELDDLEAIVKTACSHGHFNYDEYMYGMTNGLILALAVMKGEEPMYLDRPETWLCESEETVGTGVAFQYGTHPEPCATRDDGWDAPENVELEGDFWDQPDVKEALRAADGWDAPETINKEIIDEVKEQAKQDVAATYKRAMKGLE